MNTLRYLGIVLFMTLGLVSCSDKFDVPEPVEPHAVYDPTLVKSIIDIKETYLAASGKKLSDSWANKITEDVLIKGRVVSSDEAGNVYKALYISDGTATMPFSINQASMYTTFHIGQEVVVNLKNMYIGTYAGLLQVGELGDYQGQPQVTFMSFEAFQAAAQKNGLPNLDAPELQPRVVSVGTLGTSDHDVLLNQGALVRFNDMEFETPGVVLADYQVTTNRTAQGPDGSLIVRTSGYANFRTELCPEGSGSIQGILSYFNGTWQMILRDIDDLVGFVNDPKGKKDDPYTVEEARVLMNQGKQAWVKGYIVGAVAPAVSTVSKNEDIQWSANTDMDNTVVIADDANCKDFTKCIVVTLPAGSDIRKAANLADAREGYTPYQKALNVRGVFADAQGMAGVATSGAAAEFELEGYTPPTPPPPVGGDGSKENPYTIEQTLSGTGSGSNAWVGGYIVGFVEGQVLSEGARFTAEGAVASNLLLADAADCKDVTKCIPIQLVYDTEARLKLNLQANPSVLGMQVKVYGQLTKYFGANAVKSVSDYELNGQPTPPPTPDEFKPSSVVSTAKVGDNVTVQGWVTAHCTSGFIVTDNSGSILVYGGNNYDLTNYPIGMQVSVAGAVSEYNKGLQMSANSCTITTFKQATYTYPAPAVVDGAAMDAACTRTESAAAQYVRLVGTVSVSGNYFNVAVEGATTTGSIYYPTQAIKDKITDGQKVTITGYFMAVSGGGKYYNVIATDITNGDTPTPPPTPGFEATSVVSTLAKGSACDIKGWVVATASNGFVVADKSGAIFVYKAAASTDCVIGKQVQVTGTVSSYNKGLQVDGASATITYFEQDTYSYPTATVVDGAAMDAALTRTTDELAQYVQIEGALTISGTYYNLAVAGSSNQGSIYYATDAIKAKLESGKSYRLKGYFMAISGSGKYYNIIVTDVVAL